MRTTSVLAAALVAVSSVVASQGVARPKYYFPRHIKRQFINATITSLVNNTLSLNITDAFCGFKAHRVSAMMPLKLDEPGYAFPLQLWPLSAMAGMRITEIPVRLIYKDPNRHFGGMLDDPDNRLRHYLDVLCAEQKRIDASVLDRNNVPCPCGCD